MIWFHVVSFAIVRVAARHLVVTCGCDRDLLNGLQPLLFVQRSGATWQRKYNDVLAAVARVHCADRKSAWRNTPMLFPPSGGAIGYRPDNSDRSSLSG
jgi:hypothetical protein